MPIPIIDKMLHRSYEPTLDRALRFTTAELGYANMKVGQSGVVSGDTVTSLPNLRGIGGRQVSTLRSLHSRAQEIYAELQRKNVGNERKKALHPENPAFISRAVTLNSLMRVISDHPFYQKAAVNQAITSAVDYRLGDRALDSVKGFQKKAGLWLRENRVTGVSLSVSIVALKLAIVYACAKHLLHSTPTEKKSDAAAPATLLTYNQIAS